jgi:hypothetical protein
MHENSDFAMKIYEINVELSGNSQRYVNEYCESKSDGKIDGSAAGCCKYRGGGGCHCHIVSKMVFIWNYDCYSHLNTITINDLEHSLR